MVVTLDVLPACALKVHVYWQQWDRHCTMSPRLYRDHYSSGLQWTGPSAGHWKRQPCTAKTRGCTSRNVFCVFCCCCCCRCSLEREAEMHHAAYGYRNGIVTNTPSEKWAQQGFFFFFSTSGPVGLQSTFESHENRTLNAAILCLTGCVSNNKQCISHVRTPLWSSEAQSAVHETLQLYAT